MGIYDRQYYRDDEPASLLGGRSMVTNLILVNAAIFLLDILLFTREELGGGPPHKTHLLGSWLAVQADLFWKPWNCWQLLTYGFAHDAGSIMHVLFNMLALWIFGVDVENIYGRKEFLRVYLTLVVMSGLVWVVAETAVARGEPAGKLIGASGAVMGVMVLYVMHYPRRMFYFWGIFPVPAWALAAFYLLGDVLGMLGASDHVAHGAHLAGAAFGFVYYRSGWNLGRWIPQRWSLSAWKLRPRLRIHDPEFDDRDLTRQVDVILEKISREGEASLTKKERRTLEQASRRYQRKRQ